MAIVFLEQSPELPLVNVYIAFRSGSTCDPVGRDGLARFVARMLRRGTEGHSPAQIEDRIDSLGGEFSAEVTRAVTSVYFKVIRRSLEPFADLVSKMLGRPTFDAGQIERLRRLAMGEIVAARDSDKGLASRAFRHVLFHDHLYARSIPGTASSVRSITRADVLDFYRRHYTRANAVVAISGPIDEEEASELANKLLSLLPEGEAIEDPAPPPPVRQGVRLVIVDKPGRTQTQLVMGCLGAEVCKSHYLPLFVSTTAFGGTFMSRLVQEVRAHRGWSYFATAHLAVNRQREAFTIRTAPSARDAAKCLELELQLMRSWVEDGLTQPELESITKYLIRSFAFEIDTARKRVLHRLEAELLWMPQGNPKVYLERLNAMTTEKTNTTTRELISPDHIVIAAVGDYDKLGGALERVLPSMEELSVLPPDFE